MNRQKFIVYAGIFLDVLGIGVLIPATAELMQYYQVTDRQISLGLTVYAFCAFLAAPVLGQLSDKYGRKNILILCLIGTTASFGILFLPTFGIYLISRVINGITGGNISIYQAILSDISKDNDDRKKNFGILWALFGLWFIVGPLVGAILVKQGIEWVFGFCFVFSLIETIMIVWKYKETNQHITHRKITYNPLPVFVKYLRQKKYNGVMGSSFFLNAAAFSYQSIMAILLVNRFGTPGYEVWYYLAVIGLVSAINQGFLVPKFWTKFFSNKQLFYIIHIAIIPLFFLMALAPNLWIFLAAWFAVVPFASLAMTVYNSEIIQHSHKTEVGEVSGLMWSIGSLTMFVWPLIGSYALLKEMNVFYVTVGIAVLSFISILYYIRVIHSIEAWTTNASSTA